MRLFPTCLGVVKGTGSWSGQHLSHSPRPEAIDQLINHTYMLYPYTTFHISIQFHQMTLKAAVAAISTRCAFRIHTRAHAQTHRHK
jgi:hypothetical protein